MNIFLKKGEHDRFRENGAFEANKKKMCRTSLSVSSSTAVKLIVYISSYQKISMVFFLFWRYRF